MTMTLNKMSKPKRLIVIVLFSLWIFSLWWAVAQWQECKKNGFSTFYCIQHIS